MKIHHIALSTAHLEELAAFYKRYFGGVERHRYQNPRTGLRSCTLGFDGGSRLEIISSPGVVQKAPERTVGFTHIAITVGGAPEVDFITRRLEDDGYPIVSQPRLAGNGYYESTILDPDGNWVEINGKP